MSPPARSLTVALVALCALSVLTLGPAAGVASSGRGDGSPAVTKPLPNPAKDPAHVYLPNVRPAPAHAESDEPVVYRNGCHVYTRAGTYAHFCIYGDKHAKTKVVLFGDSHVAQWFPAFDAAARSQHVMLLYITKTSCPAQDVSVRVWQRNIGYPACDVWRNHAIDLIKSLKHVDLIVLGGYAHHQITKRHTNSKITNPAARAKEWRAGTRRTVVALRGVADHVVILRDTPLMQVVSAHCLLQTHGNNKACQTLYSRASAAQLWQSEQMVAKEYANVGTADFTSAFCTATRCRPVTSTRILRWRDQSHMSVTFSRLLAPRVRTMIRQAMAGRLSD